jgi:hypothetical protein
MKNEHTLTEKLNSSIIFFEWLSNTIFDNPFQDTRRNRAAGSCFTIAQDHYHAILLLTQHQRYASSFSLLRVEFEAYIRGLWLYHCACDSEIERFLKGKEPPKIDVLLEAIEKTHAFSENQLSEIKEKFWKSMCGYTHTGGLHIQRWNSNEAIEPIYSDEEIIEVILFAELISAMSVLACAQLANNNILANKILEKMETRY